MARPSSYEPEFCDRVRELGLEGKSKAQIAATLGVNRTTLDNWAAAHEEFLSALKDARDLALNWWETKGQDGLTADKFNATLFIFQMKNRFREDYRDQTELTGANGGPIETKANDGELAREIAFLLRKATGALPT